jgi:hypothetical protein
MVLATPVEVVSVYRQASSPYGTQLTDINVKHRVLSQYGNPFFGLTTIAR